MQDFSAGPEGKGTRAATTPFVGRQGELSQLKETLEAVAGGAPRIVLIGGEAGLGKTRLLREMRSVFDTRASVLHGRCYEATQIPYLPFIEILRSLSDEFPEAIDSLQTRDRDIIERLLGRSEGDAPQAEVSASDDRRALLFSAVSNLILQLCASRPLVILLDDLHWMDAPSLELLAHLTFPIVETAVRRQVPVMIVATYRPDGLDERSAHAVDRLQREEVCEALALEGLSEFEVEQMVRGLGFERPSHQFVVTIATATRGNPLFIQEALSFLRASNAVGERGGYLVITASPADLKMPSQIADVISSRVAGLAEEDRSLLTLAAFLGDHFSYETLAAVCGQDEDSLLDILDRAIRGRFLANEEDGFSFAHPLIRHVLYGDTSVPRRHKLHKQLAEGLEELYADNIEEHLDEIAHHLMHCGKQAQPGGVLEVCRAAGERALGLYAWGEAARYFDAAVKAAVAAGNVTDNELANLHHRAGFAYYRDLDIGPAIEHYREAIASFKESGDRRALVTTLIQYAKCRITQASVAFGTKADVEMLEEQLQDLGEEDTELRAQVLAQLSQVYWTARQPAKAESTALEALALAESLEADQVVVEACSSLGLAYLMTLRLRESLESYRRGLTVARRTGDPWLEGWPLARIPLAHVWLGELDNAESAAAEG